MHQKYRECPSYRVRRGALVHGAELPGGVNQRTRPARSDFHTGERREGRDNDDRDVRHPRVQKRIKDLLNN